MDEKQIFEKLVDIIIDVKEEEVDLKLDTPLIKDQIFDSLELINYLTQIEEVFDLNISLDELQDKELGIMKNMVDYIKSKQS